MERKCLNWLSFYIGNGQDGCDNNKLALKAQSDWGKRVFWKFQLKALKHIVNCKRISLNSNQDFASRLALVSVRSCLDVIIECTVECIISSAKR